MANTVAGSIPQDANEDAELQQAVRQMFAQMEELNTRIEHNQQSTDRVCLETQAMLSQLKSFLKME